MTLLHIDNLFAFIYDLLNLESDIAILYLRVVKINNKTDQQNFSFRFVLRLVAPFEDYRIAILLNMIFFERI